MADMAEDSNDLMTTSALLINMQNPKVTNYTDRKVEDYKDTNDSFIIEATEKDALDLINGRDGYNIENFKKEYVVFEPEQIHILGSKQDIEGFKKFVSSNVVETTPTDNIVAYGGKNFIVEGSPERGNAVVFFTKNNGSKGAELTSDKPLYRKVVIATYAQDHPEDIVVLTDLQGSPEYLTTPTGKIVSLNPTSYGDEIYASYVFVYV